MSTGGIVEKQNLSKIDSLLAVTARLESSIRFLEEAVKANQQETKSVSTELQKKSEEIKDAYYLAEMNRQRVVEYNETYTGRLHSQDKLIEEVKDSVKDLKEAVGELEEQKYKKSILLIQAIITTLSICFGIAVKLGIL